MKIKAIPFKRILSLLLVLATICTTLAACASDETIGDGSESGESILATGESNSSSNNDDADSEDLESDADGIIPIFANGAYTAKIIRSDTPSALDKNMYNQLREVLKSFTGVNPEFNTDFVTAGTEKYDGPAILVGKTNYDESISATNKLGDSQASATISGNKYVITASSIEAFDKLLTTFKTTLKSKATKTEIKIDSKWKISAKADFFSPNVTFDENGAPSSVNVNSLLNVDSATFENKGSGQGSRTYISTKKGVTKATFEEICKKFANSGAKKYTANSIGNNLFATYVTKNQIIHLMFFPTQEVKDHIGEKNKVVDKEFGVIRVTEDVRGEGNDGFTLPGLSGENTYKKTTESKMIVCDIGNADWPGGMCIIYKLADGRFFIVDAGIGGKMSDGRTYVGSSSGWIYATLAKHAADPKNIEVAAWLITHPHSDHAGGLYDMALGYHGKKGGAKHTVMPKDMKKYVKIDTIIYNAPNNLPDCNREKWMGEIIDKFNVKNVVKAHAGQVFYYADLTFTVYGSLDIMIEDEYKCGDTNEFSLAIRTEFNGKSALLLGDSDGIPNLQLAQIYQTSLKSDILQLAHHGYGDTGDDNVNSYCNPSWVLWCVADDDLRTNYKINVNSSIATLKNVTNYKPGTGNLVFDSNWKLTKMSRTDMCNAIPNCDGSICGYKNCQTNTSFRDKYT